MKPSTFPFVSLLVIYLCRTTTTHEFDESFSRGIVTHEEFRVPGEFRGHPQGRKAPTTSNRVIRRTESSANPMEPSVPSPASALQTQTEELPSHCLQPGYTSDPKDCRKFYNCVQPKPGAAFLVILLNCVSGTIFDPAESKCSENVVQSGALCGGKDGSTSPSASAESMDDLGAGAGHGEIEPEPISKDSLFWPEAGTSAERPDSEPHFESELASLNNYEYLHVPEGRNPIRIREVESFEDFEPITMEQLQSRSPPASGSAKTRIIKTSHSSPNAWFGLVRTNNDGPGNPFKEEETSLAIILDFSTSRLQIFSRNMPKNTHRK